MSLLSPQFRAFLILVFIGFGQAHAETVAQSKSVLAGLEDRLFQQAESLKTIEGRIRSYSKKIIRAESDLASAKAELSAANKEVIKAYSDKSQDNTRMQDNAARNHELAEKTLHLRQKRLDRAQRKLEELQQERNRLQLDTDDLQKKITEQTERVLVLTTLASSQPAKASASPKLLKAKPDAPKRPAPEPAPPETPSLPVAIKTVDDAPVKPTATPKPELSSQQRYARTQMKIMNDLIADAPEDESPPRAYKDLELKLGKEVVEFEYLGNRQFYTEVMLSHGSHKIKIADRRYNITIPETEKPGLFVVIYNVLEPNKPSFIIFSKAMLD